MLESGQVYHARQLLAWVLVLFLSFAAASVEEPTTLRFDCDPPDARVVDASGNFLGQADAPISLVMPKTGEVYLYFQADGYHPYELRERAERLQAARGTSGKILLRAKHPFVVPMRWAQRHPAATSLLALLATGLAAWLGLNWARSRGRARRLRELEAAAGDEGSLVMEVVGTYRLVELLGRGGMAAVYRGLPNADLDPTRAVAVKVMSRALSQDPEFVERFRREVSVFKQLQHPNIVALLDWGEHGGRLYLVMELVEGTTLASEVMPGGRPLGNVLRLLGPVFTAVQFAHDRGVVHRDLKPDNIMVDHSGRPKIMDFGLARAGDADKLTQTGHAMGTPHYMPPEQISGEAGVDPRQDQYALGIITYLFLCGELPFQGDDIAQVIYKQMTYPVPPMPNVVPQVEAVVQRMLSKEASQRYPDVTSAWSALQAAAGVAR